MASPTLFHHPEFADEDHGDGEAFAAQAGRHIQELQRLSAFQQVTTKVPPAYDGRSSWFAYEEAIDDWVDITELEPDREKLKDKVNGVQYFKSYLRPLFVKGASNVFLYRFQQFMTLHRGSGDMLRWITRFQLSRARMQEAWDDTYVPITGVNNPEVRAYVSTLTQEEQNTITPEEALSAANARMKGQHSRTIPITENLVALMFVSLADLTQDQRQVLTSLMVIVIGPLQITAFKSCVKSTWKSSVLQGLRSRILCWLHRDMPAEKPSSSSMKATWTPMKDSGLRTKRMEPRGS